MIFKFFFLRLFFYFFKANDDDFLKYCAYGYFNVVKILLNDKAINSA